MKPTEKIIAKELLEIKAVRLSPDKPFTWVSGWKSPIYCDNRKILSYPKSRKIVFESLAKLIEKHYQDVDCIAGIATGAIAWGVLVAEVLNKPFVYVRAKAKDYGTESQVEGALPPNANVVVVEDLISTGQSSISAVDALQAAGANVIGMVAIFSYNFDKSRRAFENKNLELRTLTNYDTLLEEALNSDYIQESELATLREWRFRPDQWGR